MRIGLLALAVAVVATATSAVGTSAVAQSTPARVFDRTYACSTLVHAGVRKMTVSAWSAGAGQQTAAGIGVVTGGIPAWTPTGSPGTTIVGGATLVAAGASGAKQGDWFIVSSKQCRPSSRRVAFSPRGLEGGAASSFGDAFECFPPRTILLRTRAVFRSPTRLRPDPRRQYLRTSATVREAAFAATTLVGKPLVYAAAFESGKARLFTSRGCVPD